MLKTPIYLSTSLEPSRFRQKAIKAIVKKIIISKTVFPDSCGFAYKAMIFFQKAIVSFRLVDQPVTREKQ